MENQQFPIPREPLDNQVYLMAQAVNTVINELRSYPAGVPIERIETFLESDFDNWQDIMLIILSTPKIDVFDGMLVYYD